MAWCFGDEANPYADRVLDELALDDCEAVVPALWTLEVVNVLLVAERKKRLSPAQGRRFLELLAGLPITVEEESLYVRLPELLALGRECGLSAYDASYLELAERRGLALATGDKALRTAVTQREIGLLFGGSAESG